MHRAVIALCFLLILPGCRRQSDSTVPAQTQTVAPAASQPAPSGNDAVTQTVNVDDGRSQEEGTLAGPEPPAPAGKDAAAGKAAKPAKKGR